MTPITQVCDPQIIQHQSTFVVSDSVNHLCVYDNIIKSDQVRNEQSNLMALVENIERRLLAKWNPSQTNSTTNAFSYGLSCALVVNFAISFPLWLRCRPS